jgi:3-carboxy-cis,cis-muconate cycloisomerase
MDALFEPIFGATAIGAATDARAWLAALAEVETALARAAVRAGRLDLPAALEIGAAAEALARTDPAELGQAALAGGNPVIPFVTRLREAVGNRAGAEAAAGVHLGATSQDVLDTAMMLVAHRGLGVITAGLADCADTCAALARQHRETAMAGRTLLQRAVPTTFGAVAAGWGVGLDRALARLSAVRDTLAVQYGGAAGTLAAVHPDGPAIRAALADELGLADPGGTWHTERSRITDLAGTLGTAAAALGKVAGDIVLLAQTEVGEVREAAPGGSSAMPHKQNPIAAITARAATISAPGLVATLLSAGSPELQRGAGAWHAEWPALTRLLQATGGAASRLSTSLVGLHVETAAMERNLGGVDDPVPVEAAAAAVDEYLSGRRR